MLFSKYKIILFLTSVIFVLFFLLVFLSNKTTMLVSMSNSADSKLDPIVYIPNSNPVQGFLYKENQYSFILPKVSTIDYVRLDPTTSKTSIFISSIVVIETDFFKKRIYNLSIDNLNPLSQISNYEKVNSGIKFTTTGNDPFLDTNFNLIHVSTFYETQWDKLLIAIFVILIMYLFYVVMTKEQFTSIRFKINKSFDKSFLELNTKFYLFSIFPLLLSIFLLVPNLQTPDSNYHFMKQYTLSEGDLKITTIAGQSTGGFVDKNVIEYINLMMYIKSDRRSEKNTAIIQKATNLRFSNFKIYADFAGSNYYNPIIYLPSAMVLKIGKILDLTINNTYSLIRFFNIILALLIVAVALKLLSARKEFVLLILFLPMTLAQMTGVGIDGLIFSLSLLLASLFLYGIDKANSWNLKLSFLSWFILGLLITVRPSYLPFGLLFLWILIYRKSYKDLLPLVLATTSSIGWILYALKNVIDLRIPRELTNSELLSNFIGNPSIFFSPLLSTLSNEDMLTGYWRMFVGILGWLDTPLPDIIYTFYGYLLFLVLLILLYFRSTLSKGISILLIFTLLSSSLMIFFLLWLSWTPIGSDLILGVQGRYFIPIFLVFGALISYNTKIQNQKLKNLLVLAVIFWIILVYSILPYTLWNKFW